MTMTIGKEARDEIALLITSLPDKQAVPDRFVKEIISVLDRCTDAPEVELAVAGLVEAARDLVAQHDPLMGPGEVPCAYVDAVEQALAALEQEKQG